MIFFFKCVFRVFIGVISVGNIGMDAMSFEEFLLGSFGLLLIILAFRGLIKLIKWLKHRKKQ